MWKNLWLLLHYSSAANAERKKVVREIKVVDLQVTEGHGSSIKSEGQMSRPNLATCEVLHSRNIVFGSEPVGCLALALKLTKLKITGHYSKPYAHHCIFLGVFRQ